MWNVPGVHQLGIQHFQLENFVDGALHTIDCGVAQRYCGHALRCALRNNVFGLHHSTLKEQMAIGALRIREAEQSPSEAEQSPSILLEEDWQLRPTMFEGQGRSE